MARRVMTHSIISEPLISVPKSAGRVKRVLSQTYAKKRFLITHSHHTNLIKKDKTRTTVQSIQL